MLAFLANFIPGVGPFLSAAGQFIAKHWKAFAIGTMIGLLAYQNFSSTRFLFWIPTIPHLHEVIAKKDGEIKQLKTDLNTAIDANKQLTETITAQNATVEQWKAVSSKLEQRGNEYLDLINGMRKDNNKVVQSILSSKTPETCEASIQYLRDMRSQLKW